MMKVTVGRCNALSALSSPQACAMPDGKTTGGYTIKSEIIELLLRNEMIAESRLTAKARKKYRIVFVYTITETGRKWLVDAVKTFKEGPSWAI